MKAYRHVFGVKIEYIVWEMSYRTTMEGTEHHHSIMHEKPCRKVSADGEDVFSS